MKIADMTSGPAKMNAAYKALRLRWDQTKEHWHDENCKRFEQNFLDPLEPQLSAALEAIAALAEVFSRAERDCE